jgi:hypothetical protein
MRFINSILISCLVATVAAAPAQVGLNNQARSPVGPTNEAEAAQDAAAGQKLQDDVAKNRAQQAQDSQANLDAGSAFAEANKADALAGIKAGRITPG